MFQESVSSSELNLFTDASMLGCGGIFQNKWFSLAWPDTFLSYDINFLELFAIFVAISTWGSLLKNKQSIVFCGNLDVVTVWKSGSCKNKNVMKLMRALFFRCAVNNINLLTSHIPGNFNTLQTFFLVYRCRSFYSV